MIFRTAFLAAAWPFLAAAWPFLAAAWPNGLRHAQPRVNAAAAEDVILHPPPNPPQCRLHELRSVDRAFSHFSLPSLAALQSCSPAVLQPCGLLFCSRVAGSLAACSLAVFQLAALWPCSLVAMQPRGPAVCSLALATLQRSVPWELARRTGMNPFFGHARRRYCTCSCVRKTP